MENNYYTPELSDLYIGYECEVKIGEEWEKTNLTDSIQFPHVELRLSQGRLRTPYLTKEQMPHGGYTETFDANKVTRRMLIRMVNRAIKECS